MTAAAPPQFDPARLVRMRDRMRFHVEQGGIPGVVTLVDCGGGTHVDAFGDGVARDTIFRIASVTKPLTAVAALILVEECRLRLDDPVDELLPELADRRVIRDVAGPLDDTVPARRAITVRDVLTFRLGYGLVMEAFDGPLQHALSEVGQGPPAQEHYAPVDEWMARLGRIPLSHQPGAEWRYNTGSDVLGVLITRASGQTLGEFMSSRIFEPLGMRDTGFFVPPDKVSRLASRFDRDPDTNRVRPADEPPSEFTQQPHFESGAGGLVSTVDDLLAFGSMLRGGGGDILSKATVASMTTDQLTEENKRGAGLVESYWESHGWGFGVSVVTKDRHPGEPVGQYGWDGGFGTSFAVDPVHGLVGVQLTQVAWTNPKRPPVCEDFWTTVHQALV